MSETSKLTLVSESVYRLDRPPESMGERVRRRQFEARILAREHIDALRKALAEVGPVAELVAKGGDVYPAGVREAAGRVLAQLEQQSRTLDALMDRIPEPEL